MQIVQARSPIPALNPVLTPPWLNGGAVREPVILRGSGSSANEVAATMPSETRLDGPRQWLAFAARGCAILALGALAACSTANAPAGDAAANDPIEPFNRYIFEVNRFGDEFVGKPLATIYRQTVPYPARNSVANAVSNLRLPWTAVNDVLQGQFGRAGDAIARFGLNSTFGVLGLFDMAKDNGYPHHDEDFGQTLAIWGFGGDPYLMLPIFGPSSPRDTVGLVADRFLDPVTIVALDGDITSRGNAFTWTRTGVAFVSGRERTLEGIAELERGQDYYAAVRSAY
ncbi:MAG: VacJ family lipoprotein, partial [Alphaproteobacteria bacterium]|nr:VacJ family lipoprotein [Alphaproteobacteria bacterium]